MSASGANQVGSGGLRKNDGGIYNDPQACKSYIGEYPSSNQFGEIGRRYTYPDATQQQQQQQYAPPHEYRIGVDQQECNGPNGNDKNGGNYQSAASQKPSMQAWLNSNTDYAPSHYISYGGLRRQN